MTTYPFIPCYHASAGSNLPVHRIVIHGTVSATKAGGARQTAKYFQNASSGGSAQYVIDPGEIVQCAKDSTICWHAPPNPHSIGIELCDWVAWNQGNGKTVADIDPFWHGKTEADFNARWDLPDWDKMLRKAAGLTRDLASAYGVPLTRIGVSGLLAGKEGITGHVDVARAWKQSDHFDPNWTDATWNKFIGYCTQTAPKPVKVPAATKGPVVVPKPGVLNLDGGLGPATIRRWQQVMGTPVDGSISVPSSLVKAVQRRLNAALGGTDLLLDGKGLIQDDHTVTKTNAALQRYLGTPADGVLSRPSSSAIVALQKRLNQGKF